MDSSVTPLRHGGLSLVQTTDFFYPLVDDPYMMGKIEMILILNYGTLNSELVVFILKFSRVRNLSNIYVSFVKDKIYCMATCLTTAIGVLFQVKLHVLMLSAIYTPWVLRSVTIC